MNRTQKAQAVTQWTEKFGAAQATIFAEYRGLTVAQMTQLRTKMRGAVATFNVVKNRLAKRAASAAKMAGVEHFFKGPTAVAASRGDAAALAKALVEFAKDNEKLLLKGGVVEGKVLDLGAIKALATLPAREVLLAQVVGMLRAPAQRVVNVLSGVPRQLVTVMKAIEGTKK